MRGDRVSELAGILDLIDRNQYLWGDLLVKFDILLKLRDYGPGQRFGLLLRAGALSDGFRKRLEE